MVQQITNRSQISKNPSLHVYSLPLPSSSPATNIQPQGIIWLANDSPQMMASVAVAVKGQLDGGGGGKASRHAVRWAIENFMPKSSLFVLVHVMPKVTSIPTPCGDRIPISELDDNVVEMFVQETKKKYHEVFIPFLKLCKQLKEVETVVLEDDNPATALLQFISESKIKTLVLGSCSSSFFGRKLQGQVIPETVLRCAPENCDIYVVDGNYAIKKSENCSMNRTLPQKRTEDDHSGMSKQVSDASSLSGDSETYNLVRTSPPSELSHLNCQASAIMDSLTTRDQERNGLSLGDDHEINPPQTSYAMTSMRTAQSNVDAEVEQLRLELQYTIAMYKKACEELVQTQNQVNILSSECLEEARRVDTTLQREEMLRKIALEQKAKYIEAMKDVEEAKRLLAKETFEREIAELKAFKESLDKQKTVDALLSTDMRYRRYTLGEIEAATDSFSEDNVIGEGAYGKVYKGCLDHTTVAIKTLRTDALDKKMEFLREVEILSQLRHPHMVLLLGACPERGCLVYEYLENGSLDEYLYHQKRKLSLPWFVRFRIAFEVASGLAFLHYSKPEPIVHRDLKPGNILLGRNYVSKIADVGLAKLLSDVVPDSVTQYGDSMLAGTMFYMDPEYQRTGTIRPKSDLYAFGIIILQLLLARHPNGLVRKVEEALANGSLSSILDSTVTDWPIAETEELARVALQCSRLRCRDRPDLESEVLPVLKKLVNVADANLRSESNGVHAPSHYYCPILQEVMDDPYIAADGFSYERRAINAWLNKHMVSPVTQMKLQHATIVPNHSLRSAIQDWRSRISS